MNQLSYDFVRHHTSSFTEFVDQASPHLLPQPEQATPSSRDLSPEATTIVAATMADGVMIAGDRRATMGSMIAQRDIEKVFAADDHSAVGIAGSAGLAVELVKLLRVELEHYEKIEGVPLTLNGKARRLATMIRGNLGLALQGFVVVPLFVGWDQTKATGRIFSYDATGGCYEETGYHSIGSGSVFAKGSLKKMFRPGLSESRCATMLIQALFDAADDDSATGGPDLARRIFPVVISVTADGAQRLPESDVGKLTEKIVSARLNRADGPEAKLL